MDKRTLYFLVLVTYITLLSVRNVTARSHGLKYHHNHHHHSHLHNSNHNRNHHSHSSTVDNSSQQQLMEQQAKDKSTITSWRPTDEDYEDEEDHGRHAYLMDTTKKTSNEKVTEDQTLTQAFEKHMKPGAANIHDVYSYQLPSDLWFVVRYAKNPDGQVEKYMNVVDSFTNYLEKLDKDVRTVSVNVKGVETVFRLTPKRKPDN